MADDGQPQGEDTAWADMSLEQILAEADKPIDPALACPLSIQEAVAQQLGTATVGAVSGRYVYSVDDSFGQVLEWVRGDAGRQLGTMPVWLRIWRPDLERGALFVLSGPRPGDEAELIVVSQHGAISRSMLRAVARWMFVVVGLRRAVLRVSTDRPDLADLARRAGFAFEGTARDALGDGLDAGIWAMTARSCRWLPHAPSPIPTKDLGPRHSPLVH